jgi:hypothetical protein
MSDDLDDEIKAIRESNRSIVDALHNLELTMARETSQLEAKLDTLNADLGKRFGRLTALIEWWKGGRWR